MDGDFKNVELVGSGTSAGIMLQTERGWVQKEPATSPLPRNGHAMAAIDGTDKVVLFGGYNDSHGDYGDTWTYDFSENKWEKIAVSPKPP